MKIIHGAKLEAICLLLSKYLDRAETKIEISSEAVFKIFKKENVLTGIFSFVGLIEYLKKNNIPTNDFSKIWTHILHQGTSLNKLNFGVSENFRDFITNCDRVKRGQRPFPVPTISFSIAKPLYSKTNFYKKQIKKASYRKKIKNHDRLL